MTIDALSGEWTWPVDQVGPQTLTVRRAVAVDVSARTYQCEIWTSRVEEGGVKVGDVTVDHTTDGATGILYLGITAVLAELLESGYWAELIELTPVERPLLRGQLATRRRVID